VREWVASGPVSALFFGLAALSVVWGVVSLAHHRWSAAAFYLGSAVFIAVTNVATERVRQRKKSQVDRDGHPVED